MDAAGGQPMPYGESRRADVLPFTVPLANAREVLASDPMGLSRALLGGYAIACGLITLVGWTAGVDGLRDWIDSGVTMKANPADMRGGCRERVDPIAPDGPKRRGATSS